MLQPRLNKVSAITLIEVYTARLKHVLRSPCIKNKMLACTAFNWLTLRPLQQILRPLQLTLRSLQLALSPLQLALSPLQLPLRPLQTDI